MSEFESDTIQKCPHDAENPYAIISRALIRDKTLSPECRWLLIYLLSNADGWVIKMRQICKHLEGFRNCGRDRVYQIVDEAIEAGYMKRDEYFKNNLKRYRYFVSESPKFKKSFRCPGSQDTGCPNPGDQGSPKKEHPKDLPKEDIPKREREEAAPSPALFKMGVVKMTKEEHDALVEQYGEAVMEDYVERLDLFSKTNPKKFKEYACHRSVIRTWLKKDNVRRIPLPSINDQIFRKPVETGPNPFAALDPVIDPVEEAKKAMKDRHFALAEKICNKNRKLQMKGTLFLDVNYLKFPELDITLMYDYEKFEEKLWPILDKLHIVFDPEKEMACQNG